MGQNNVYKANWLDFSEGFPINQLLVWFGNELCFESKLKDFLQQNCIQLMVRVYG